MKIKRGVRLRGLRTEMLFGHCVVSDVMKEAGVDCIVTSANDSGHGWGSLHYGGAALDYRMKHIPVFADKMNLVTGIKDALGAEFDVLHEDSGGANEHLHVEYQPKGA